LAHELLSCGFEWIDIKDPAAEQFVVQIRNLNYYYGQGELCTQVLHNINLDLRKGRL